VPLPELAGSQRSARRKQAAAAFLGADMSDAKKTLLAHTPLEAAEGLLQLSTKIRQPYLDMYAKRGAYQVTPSPWPTTRNWYKTDGEWRRQHGLKTLVEDKLLRTLNLAGRRFDPLPIWRFDLLGKLLNIYKGPRVRAMATYQTQGIQATDFATNRLNWCFFPKKPLISKKGENGQNKSLVSLAAGQSGQSSFTIRSPSDLFTLIFGFGKLTRQPGDILGLPPLSTLTGKILSFFTINHPYIKVHEPVPRMKVRMVDTLTGKVHWDAVFQLQHFGVLDRRAFPIGGKHWWYSRMCPFLGDLTPRHFELSAYRVRGNGQGEPDPRDLLGTAGADVWAQSDPGGGVAGEKGRGDYLALRPIFGQIGGRDTSGLVPM